MLKLTEISWDTHKENYRVRTTERAWERKREISKSWKEIDRSALFQQRSLKTYFKTQNQLPKTFKSPINLLTYDSRHIYFFYCNKLSLILRVKKDIKHQMRPIWWKQKIYITFLFQWLQFVHFFLLVFICGGPHRSVAVVVWLFP